MKINTDKNCNIIIYDDTEYPVNGLYYQNSVTIFIVQLNKTDGSTILYKKLLKHNQEDENPIILSPLQGGFITVYQILLPRTDDIESYDPADYTSQFLKVKDYITEDEVNDIIEQIDQHQTYNQNIEHNPSIYPIYMLINNFIHNEDVQDIVDDAIEEILPQSFMDSISESHTSAIRPGHGMPVPLDDDPEEDNNQLNKILGGYFSDGTSIYFKATAEDEPRVVNLQELIEVNPIYYNLTIFHKNFFSVCYLRKCFISLSQKLFNARGFDKCFNVKKLDESLRYKRDLVWAALNVIEYMIDSNQLAEAQRLLEQINGCNGLCSKEETGEQNCGCSK